ncbi:Alanyl-tRNA synthetase [hydrothermal vent metagenome]|uniref:Alanine--tRNA ligase n=1 Tax=hydrothermal vent metagenome TaxID=652676 RepID=A0A3B1DG62_9ZZZZ
MTSREIRESFLRFFGEKDHEVVKSSPLVPHDDPTLLFTNAGMVQFKGVFLGIESRPYRRAASCQKCMRAGGKHSDLENVGHTARHHTFFEMLGNFSFGDYFKKEAISLAWELLTERFKLPKEKLYATVYEEDDETERIWKDETGIAHSRIVRLGAKDNFWQMADTGPCGPCSEILIDQGESVGCGSRECAPGCDCDRFLELWNLVFMQYNRDEKGNLTPLPHPSIDTGMGLERITAVLQGKLNNFDTDLFEPVIREISILSGVKYGFSPDTDASIRVIADHVRATTFLISEGIVPSNEGRGYVLRRIIRRASRHARLLNLHEPCLYKMVIPVVDSMGDLYPEIIDERERTQKLLRIEEERFTRTIELGMNILDDVIAKIKKQGETVIPGEEVFKLYDTYGFPLDLARDIAMDAGLSIDEEGFQREMEMQRKRARAVWNAEDRALTSVYTEIVKETGETEFTGYNTLKTEATIKALIKEGQSVEELAEGEEGEIILDRTPFYAESGGQAGDTGIMETEEAHVWVLDTKKPVHGLHVHRAEIKRGKVKKGERVTCSVDEEKRRATMRNHTATHLLHKALRIVLGEHVRQAGSWVTPERLRFDFTHFYALQKDEIRRIEDIVNEAILGNLLVRTDVMSIEEAMKTGAVALFDEKYGETVRVVSVGDFSSELCGGTHCRATGETGLFVIVSEGSVASGVRRIEALTGSGALEYFRQKAYELDSIKELLKTETPLQKTEKLLSDMKAIEKEVQKLRTGTSGDTIAEALKVAKELNGVKVIKTRKDGLNPKELRLLADNIKDRIQSGIIIASSAIDGQAAIVCMITKDLKGHYNAGEIVRRLSALAGGKGGGRPDMAQGGIKEVEKLDSVLNKVYDIIKATRGEG